MTARVLHFPTRSERLQREARKPAPQKPTPPHNPPRAA